MQSDQLQTVEMKVRRNQGDKVKDQIQHYWTVTLMTVDMVLSDVRFWQFAPICLVLAFLSVVGFIWKNKNQ